MDELIFNVLSTNAYTPVNKVLARRIWFACAWYLWELIRECKRFWGWEFYFSQSQMEEEIWLSPYQQRWCLNELVSLWIISVSLKWLPAKYYYRLNFELIYNYLIDKNQEVDKEEVEIPKELDRWPYYYEWAEVDIPEERIAQIEVMHEVADKDNLFEKFWQVYPRKKWKAKAKDRFMKAIKDTDWEFIIKQAERYAEDCKKNWTEEKYIKRPEGWLNSKRYLDWEEEKPVMKYTIEDVENLNLSRDWKAKWASIKWIENKELREERIKKFLYELSEWKWQK